MTRMLLASGLTAALISGAATVPLGHADAPRPAADHVSIRLAAADDTTAAKDDYLRRAGDEMRAWRQKLHDLGEQTETQGHEADAKMKAGLETAWNETQEKWHGLQAASAEGWDHAKRSFEGAEADLQAEWRKVHPEDK